jgi:hypothetical protein
MDDLLTPAEKAESAFKARMSSLGLTWDDDAVLDAWDNSFSAECYREYRDDAHRWDVALSTLNAIADGAM